MNKNARKLIPAVAMLLVSASMLSTASFAWFSMNSTVKAEGMKVNVAAPASLGISVTDSDYTTAIGGAGSTALTPTEATKDKYLGHVSSVSGDKFYATNANTITIGANLDPTKSEIVDVTDVADYATVYGVANTVSYVDYEFYIATTSSEDVKVRFDTTTTSIAYVAPTTGDDDVAAGALLPALRFAVLVNDNVDTTGTSGNVWFGADNKATNNKALNAVFTAGSTKTQDDLDAIQEDIKKYDGTGEKYLTKIAASKAGGGAYGTASKITVRIWVDGMDTACKSTNIITTKDFVVNVGFVIVG